jgi:hypothetical protein
MESAPELNSGSTPGAALVAAQRVSLRCFALFFFGGWISRRLLFLRTLRLVVLLLSHSGLLTGLLAGSHHCPT